MIQWFSSLNEFEQLTELYHKTHTVYFDRLCACTDITFVELQAILPLPSDPNPFPSEPGPHDYWYGCIDNLPFLISYHHSGNREGIMTSIRTFPSHPSQGDYFWSPLKKLVALPKPIMQRIHWVGFWEQKKQPVRSLYCLKTTSIGIDSPVELYQTETVIEAEALSNFLQSLQPEYTYYIDKPNTLTNSN
jgi:hypothetical protein